MRIVAGEDVAFAHFLDRVSGTTQGGEKLDAWLRVTGGLRRIDGEWRIVHEHVSVPTNFENGTAALDLKP